MNDYITINSNNIELNGAIANNTSKLIDHIKKSINVDILNSKNVTDIKRYIEHNTIEFTFNHNNDMYIATYFIKENDYEINKAV